MNLISVIVCCFAIFSTVDSTKDAVTDKNIDSKNVNNKSFDSNNVDKKTKRNSTALVSKVDAAFPFDGKNFDEVSRSSQNDNDLYNFLLPGSNNVRNSLFPNNNNFNNNNLTPNFDSSRSVFFSKSTLFN